MDIRLYIGGHRTASRHLRQNLVQNADMLAEQGICVPDPEFAEKAFARAVKQVRLDGDIAQINATLLSALTKDQEFRRIVLVDPNISGSVLRPAGLEYFYPRIGNTIERIQSTLDGLPMRLFIAVRNPATFVPSCYAAGLQFQQKKSFAEFIKETNLHSLKWSDFLFRAQMKQEDIGVTTWRYEDYPKIWRDVAQAFTGVENKEDLVGSTAPVNAGISLKGAVLMHAYLQENKVRGATQFARVLKLFEERFPSTAGHILPPDWPEDLVTGMTENYEDDWYYIERMENVETIQPQTYL